MFAHKLPTMVVVLIVANPVFCQMRGFCEGAPSCDCEECRASCTCDGSREAQEAPTKPCDCPDDSYCQCLRAGAVIKAGPSLDDARGGFALDRITAVPTLARPALYSIPDCFGKRFPRGKANPGRIAGCLRMSASVESINRPWDLCAGLLHDISFLSVILAGVTVMIKPILLDERDFRPCVEPLVTAKT